MATADSDKIVVDPKAKNKDAAIAQALADAISGGEHLTKLVVTDTVVGAGREVKVGDTVTVHYIGFQKDGSVFDNSYKKGKPISFKVGAGDVIKGWEEGVVGMKEGGKRILVVPPELGYGSAVVDPLPANAILIFSLELLSIE